MSVTPGRLRTIVAAGIIAMAISPNARCSAQSLSPYSEFQAMSLGDLNTLQMKFTHGPQKQTFGVATLLFGGPSSTLNAGLFVPYRRSGFSYGNEDPWQQKLTLSAQELKAVMDSVGTLPGVTDGDVDAGGSVSFALSNTAGGTRVFEAIVGQTNGQAMFGKMIEALHINSQAVALLRSFGCATTMLPTTAPSSVQSQVQITPSGLRANGRNPREFVGKVRVTNSSASTLPAPVILMLQINGDANLVGSDGLTCNILPSGHPYVILNAGGALAPSASVVRTVRFDNPSHNKLNVTYRVFAGAGTP